MRTKTFFHGLSISTKTPVTHFMGDQCESPFLETTQSNMNSMFAALLHFHADDPSRHMYTLTLYFVDEIDRLLEF